MAKREDDRLRISVLGEYYEDLLIIDSEINDRTIGIQGSSLLCAKLQEREPRIKERVAYLAKKRGISFDQMWWQLRSRTVTKLSEEEILELTKGSENEENPPNTQTT